MNIKKLKRENKRLYTALNELNQINDKLEAENKELRANQLIYNTVTGFTQEYLKPEPKKAEDILKEIEYALLEGKYHLLKSRVSQLIKEVKQHLHATGFKDILEHQVVKALEFCINDPKPESFIRYPIYTPQPPKEQG